MRIVVDAVGADEVDVALINIVAQLQRGGAGQPGLRGADHDFVGILAGNSNGMLIQQLVKFNEQIDATFGWGMGDQVIDEMTLVGADDDIVTVRAP